MEVLLVATILFIVFLTWDSQFTPVRVVSVEEHSETVVCMIHVLKWPFVFKKKVYLVRATGHFVIPNRYSILEPIISSVEIEEAYIVWKYENASR
jgi:hypothetical protein